MRTKAIVIPLLALALPVALAAVGGCRSRTDRSEGTVVLSVSDFDGLPVSVSVSEGPFDIDQITLRNVLKDPSGVATDLQDVEMRSYEVRFARLDTGTRVPPPLVEGLFGLVEVGSTANFGNLPFLRVDQINNPPLGDLLRFGADQQTGSEVIPLRVTLRFFGRTLSGDDVASEPSSFNIEVFP